MADFVSLWTSLDRTVAEGWAPGLVAGVRHRGETAFHATGQFNLEQSPPMTEQTRFRIASLSKPFAGALASMLISDGVLSLDDPVDRWLPELGSPRVLVDPAGPLDQTVAAERPITVRHLLTFTNGIGLFFESTPLNLAIYGGGIGASAVPPQVSADDYMRVIGNLPLAYQPGEHWCYNTGADLISILLARASGQSLGDLLTKRICDPLGLHETSFWSDGDELPDQYEVVEGNLRPNQASIEAFAKPPKLETLAGGLVSSVPDVLTFLAALADDTLIDPALRRQMTSDQLSDAQRPGLIQLAGGEAGWGWMIGVTTALPKPWSEIGSFGWTGGSGTAAAVFPGRDLIGVVMTQRLMSGPHDDFGYFWKPLIETIDRT